MSDELSFMNTARESAAAAAHTLHGELESIGVDLSDIDVPGRCPHACAGSGGYVVWLGTLGVEEIEAFPSIRQLRRKAARADT